MMENINGKPGLFPKRPLNLNMGFGEPHGLVVAPGNLAWQPESTACNGDQDHGNPEQGDFSIHSRGRRRHKYKLDRVNQGLILAFKSIRARLNAIEVWLGR